MGCVCRSVLEFEIERRRRMRYEGERAVFLARTYWRILSEVPPSRLSDHNYFVTLIFRIGGQVCNRKSLTGDHFKGR